MGTLSLKNTNAAKVPLKSFGGEEVGILRGTFTFSSSYTPGGESLDLSKFFKRLDMVWVEPFPTTATVTAVKYDYTNKKFLAYAGGTEIAAATDLSTLTLRFAAIGVV